MTGEHCFAGLARNFCFLFQFFETIPVEVSSKPGDIAFLVFYFFFLHHARRLAPRILMLKCSQDCYRQEVMMLLFRGGFETSQDEGLLRLLS